MKMNHALAVFFFLLGTGGSSSAADADIQVEKLQGQVWYGHSESPNNGALKSLAVIHDGFLRTGTDGTLYGSTGRGSNFRIGPGSEVEIDGEIKGIMPCGVQNPLEVTLEQGKMTFSTLPGANGYEIHIPGGRICMSTSLCVLCMHGDAAHVYVARGSATLFPLQGNYHVTGLRMMARPTIAVMSKDGVLEVQALTSAAPGAVSCLLSGASPEIAQALQESVPTPIPNPTNLPVNPPVSETQ